MGLIKPWETDTSKFRLTLGQDRSILEKIRVDLVSKCRDPRHSPKVNDIIINLIKSPDVVETIIKKCIDAELKNFFETKNADQIPNEFRIIECDKPDIFVLQVTWKFSVIEKR